MNPKVDTVYSAKHGCKDVENIVCSDTIIFESIDITNEIVLYKTYDGISRVIPTAVCVQEQF